MTATTIRPASPGVIPSDPANQAALDAGHIRRSKSGKTATAQRVRSSITHPLAPHPLEFFGRLVWLDGKPLLDTIEPYRRHIFEQALYTFDRDGRPTFNMALCGRAKKNFKTCDLVLAALYRFIVWPSDQGNDCSILANDEGQAGDDLSLAKKLVGANPVLEREVTIGAKAIARKDGRGTLEILPARDAVGAHGKTKLFLGFDEIHGYRNHDLFEALAPDPTRPDVMTWITSYAGIRHAAGIPLYDFLELAKSGQDPRLFFSWYAGDYTTDPAYRNSTPERRANPSKAATTEYLAQQRRRLPTHKYRRLHLNLPGAPDGAAFDADSVMAAVISGRKSLPPEEDRRYFGFVDMSGGSKDDAVVAVSYFDQVAKRAVLARLEAQTGRPPFSSRKAVKKFAGILKEYGLSKVTGDNYAGDTFKFDFEELKITYVKSRLTRSDLYDEFEPKVNGGEVELLDIPKLQEQLLTLVTKGGKTDHQTGDHDDWANAAAGALWMAHNANSVRPFIIATPIVVHGGGISPFAAGNTGRGYIGGLH